MALSDLMVDPGDDLFYDSDFRNVLEDHMTYLRDNFSQVKMISPDQSYQWRGDMFGLLDVLGYARQYHWLIMRLNQFTSPLQFHENVLAILVPDTDEVNRIAQSHKTKQ